MKSKSVKTVFLVLFLLQTFFLFPSAAAVSIADLHCEYLTDPEGMDVLHPRLSWILVSSQRDQRQTAYQILVSTSLSLLRNGVGDLWDTGKVPSDQTTQIPYGGSNLVSREQCFWKVRSWDGSGKPSAWSSIATWQMGLLKPEDWSANWISTSTPPKGQPPRLVLISANYRAIDGHGQTNIATLLSKRIQDDQIHFLVKPGEIGLDPAPKHRKELQVTYSWDGKVFSATFDEDQMLALPERESAVPIFRKSFTVDRPVKKAILYVTALGLYRASLNGHKVGNHVMAPDWTDYRKRVEYQTYDVTHLIHAGPNAIALLLANGWYAGHIGNNGFQFFGSKPALYAQLELSFSDGTRQTVATDSTWKWRPSPILSSDIMLGEDYDARCELKNWDQGAMDDSSWSHAELFPKPACLLEAQVGEPVVELRQLNPLSISQPEPGHYIFDLGQNMVGVVRLHVSAPAGTLLTLRHAEMLNPDGTLYTRNLRHAPSIDHYICKGSGTETWQPMFTYHGFRYVELTGLPHPPDLSTIRGIVLGSGIAKAGDFQCSNPDINQLQSNIQWGERGNYFSVPTDCPQRDERLGWMGDAQVFIRTATYNANVPSFFTRWLESVDDGQNSQGAFGDVSPNTMEGSGSPGWSDAGVICPWTLYQVYGDKQLLARHLPAMIRWVECMRTRSHGFICDGNRGSDFGDWLANNAETPKDLIGTAFFAYSTHLVADSCAAIGDEQDAAKYRDLYKQIRDAFIKRYVSANGQVKGHTQCGYLLALRAHLIPPNLIPLAVDYLVQDIKDRGMHLSTGFLGVGCLLPVLAQNGQPATACNLLEQDSFPSWLFSVRHGATTIWERWDGWTPDHGFQDPSMNSFNHYSLGSCGEYFFEGIGGISPACPGFDRILIHPQMDGNLAWARTSYQSIHGPIQTSWRIEGASRHLDVSIPANTTAEVWLPQALMATTTESDRPISHAAGISPMPPAPQALVLSVGSGLYHFAWRAGFQ